MGLIFPTGHLRSGTGSNYGPMTGEPLRANACRCGDRQVLDPATDQCIGCGHYPQQVITKTWHDRAQKVARKAA